MKYPLYSYYARSTLGYSSIITHYINRFYLSKNDLEKVRKISEKVKNSEQMEFLFRASVIHHAVPNYTDFLKVINDIFWFSFRSNRTQVVGVMKAIEQWYERSQFMIFRRHDISEFMKIDAVLRYNILLLFKKLDMYEEMTEEEYKKGAC